MKSVVISIMVLIKFVVVSLVPSKTSHEQWIMPVNLYTSKGQWQHPPPNVDVQAWSRTFVAWNRTEYGLFRVWLVIDRGVTEPAYYARLSPPALILDIFVSLGLTALILILLRVRAKN